MERLFGAIPAVLNSLGPNAELESAMVFAAWKRSAGEVLSARTSALQFFENRLIVAVADQTWRRHLEDLSPQMLVKLNQYLGQGTVTFIEFVIDPGAITANARALHEHNDQTGNGYQIDPILTNAAAAITNVRLREQFISTATTYLSRQNT